MRLLRDRPGFILLCLAAFAGTVGHRSAAQAATPEPARSPVVPWVTRQMKFNIPFTVPTDGTLPMAIELYVSRDLGNNWQLVARQRPEARQFQFEAKQEAQFWFASRTLHSQQPPPRPGELRPELAVLVDLQEPEFQFEARVGPAGEVETTWEAEDLSLDAESLVVEYLPHVGQAWKPVALDKQQISASEGRSVGRMTWWPDTNANSIHVRAEVSDRAGNKSVVNRLVLLPNNPALSSQARGGPRAQPLPAGNMAAATPGGMLANNAITWPVDNRLPSTPAATPPSPAPSSSAIARQEVPARQNSNYPSTAGGPGPTERSIYQFPSPPSAVEAETRGLRGAETQFVTTRSDATPETTGDYAAETATPELAGGVPPRITRSQRFQLDYDVDAIGPAGIRTVELWGTKDQGRTWSLWQTDDDAISPVEIQVDQDALYGFRIVVVSNSGLAGPTPRNGEPADLWVRVDSSQPQLRLTSAIYGDGENAGKLDIRWQAADDSFGERPVSLSYSESADGPWTTIAAGLANTGQHFWKVDPRVPKRIYLRIEARDEAGNAGMFTLSEPINLAGLTPTARIRAVRPL